MPLVDPGILAGLQQPNMLGALQQGQQMQRGLVQDQNQAQEDQRKEAFHSALSQILQTGVDYRTPQGQNQLLQGLSKQGFGQEAMDLAAKFPKAAPTEYEFIKSNGGILPGNKSTGTVGPAILGADGQPVYDEATATKMQTAADKKKVSEADFNFGKSIPSYEKALSGIGSDMTKRDLLASKIMGEHPDSPKAEKYITSVVKSASPVMSGEITPRDRLRLENNFRTDSFKENQTYEKQAGPFINIMSAKNSKGFGTGIGDQALVDDFVSFQSKGGKPTSDQYHQSMSAYGLGDLLDKVTGRLTSGAKLPPKVREDIINTVQSQMADYHQRHLDLKDELSRQLSESGGNPSHVMKSSKYESTVGKYLTPSAPITGVHPQDDAMVKWAKENPTAQGAAEVLKANGQ